MTRQTLVRTLQLTFLVAVTCQLSAQLGFHPLPQPCRALDTRGATGTNGGPALIPGERDFQIRGVCAVPVTAKAAAINVTVTNASTSSFLTLWPSNQARPFASTINFDQTNPALANGAIITLGTATQDLAIFNAAGTVHVIIDVTGYYQ